MFFTDRYFWIKFLLVLAAIGVVAGVSIPTIITGDERRSQTASILYSLQIACENYLTEYKVLPGSSENHILIEILLGQNPKPGNEWNPRGIAFIAFPKKTLILQEK